MTQPNFSCTLMLNVLGQRLTACKQDNKRPADVRRMELQLILRSAQAIGRDLTEAYINDTDESQDSYATLAASNTAARIALQARQALRE